MSGLRLGLEFRVRVIGARWRLGFRVMLKLGLCMRAADVRDGDFRKGDVYPGGGKCLACFVYVSAGDGQKQSASRTKLHAARG